MFEVGSARLRRGPHKAEAASSGGRRSGSSGQGQGLWGDEEGGGRGSQPRWFFGSGQLRALAEQLDTSERGQDEGGPERGVRLGLAGRARGGGLAAPGEGRPGGAEQVGEEGGGLGDSGAGGAREGGVRRGRGGGRGGGGGGVGGGGVGGTAGPRTPVFVNTVLTPLQVRERQYPWL